LTTKFTQHTQERSQLSAISFQPKLSQTHRVNSMGLMPAHRALNAYQCCRAPAG